MRILTLIALCLSVACAHTRPDSDELDDDAPRPKRTTRTQTTGPAAPPMSFVLTPESDEPFEETPPANPSLAGSDTVPVREDDSPSDAPPPPRRSAPPPDEDAPRRPATASNEPRPRPVETPAPPPAPRDPDGVPIVVEHPAAPSSDAYFVPAQKPERKRAKPKKVVAPPPEEPAPEKQPVVETPAPEKQPAAEVQQDAPPPPKRVEEQPAEPTKRRVVESPHEEPVQTAEHVETAPEKQPVVESPHDEATPVEPAPAKPQVVQPAREEPTQAEAKPYVEPAPVEQPAPEPARPQPPARVSNKIDDPSAEVQPDEPAPPPEKPMKKDKRGIGLSILGGLGNAYIADSRGGFQHALAFGGQVAWNPSFAGPFSLDVSYWHAGRSTATPGATAQTQQDHVALRVLATKSFGGFFIGGGGGLLVTQTYVLLHVGDASQPSVDGATTKPGLDGTAVIGFRAYHVEGRLDLRALVRSGGHVDYLPTLAVGATF